MQFSPGTIVHFSPGTVVHFSPGTIVHFSSGTLVHFSQGTVVHLYSGILVHFYLGMVVHCSSYCSSFSPGSVVNFFFGYCSALIFRYYSTPGTVTSALH